MPPSPAPFQDDKKLDTTFPIYPSENICPFISTDFDGTEIEASNLPIQNANIVCLRSARTFQKRILTHRSSAM